MRRSPASTSMGGVKRVGDKENHPPPTKKARTDVVQQEEVALDEGMYEQKIEELMVEWKKEKPKKSRMREIMNETFVQRHRWN